LCPRNSPEISNISIKRAYAETSPKDGRRFLVDRLWPRGISRNALSIEAWLKDLAPSDSLRKWFNHDPARWHEFCRRYDAELDRQPQSVQVLREAAGKGMVTLVYAARDEARNNAVALKEYLEGERRHSPAST
jgi:uncharacterized protein YeaO (DUF488 family)